MSARKARACDFLQIYRRLEGFFEVIVANAQHIKAVRGAKNGCAGCRMDCEFAPTWPCQP
jgi:hypothetical protein